MEIRLAAHGGIRGKCSRCLEPAPGYDRLPERWWQFVPLWGVNDVVHLRAPAGGLSPARRGGGAYSYSMAVGDFNGDGKLDLAVANGGSGNVSVLLGNGDGTFQAPLNFAAGKTPWSVAVGDFNGDGKLDLAVANIGNPPTVPGSVSVLLGNGDGTFQAAASYDAGPAPFAIAVSDFNGDGKPDLAVANGWSTTVSVLLGNGDGTFQSAVGYDYDPAGLYYRAVTVGDFNGDGKPDLAVLESRSGTVGVLLGNGDGTFQSAIHYPVGAGFSAVAIADFNGDGKLDLAMTRRGAIANNFADSSVSVLLGNGDGTFQTAVNYGAGTNAFDPLSVVVGDFNGDGKPDLAAANAPTFGSGGVMVLLNTCVSAGPALAIVVNNSTLTVSWPFPSTGFVLESTPSLSPPNWQRAAETPLTNNAMLVVTAPADQRQRYFRLHKP